jgi:hypothetical protein
MEKYKFCNNNSTGFQASFATASRYLQLLIILLTVTSKIYVIVLQIRSKTKISHLDIMKQLLKIEHWVDVWSNVLMVYLYIESGSLTSVDIYLQKFASLTLLLRGLNLLFKASSVPWLGVYVAMLFSVAREYVLVFYALFLMIFVSYALAFDLSFAGYLSKSGFTAAKLLGMMIGELNLNDFIDKTVNPDQASQELAEILICSFIIIVSIVLANLLIGIVVSDIGTLKARAVQSSLCKRLENIELLELLFPRYLRKHYGDEIWSFIIVEVFMKDGVDLGCLGAGNKYSFNSLEVLEDAIEIGMKRRKPTMSFSSASLLKFNNCLDELKQKSKTDKLVRQQFVRALSEALNECLQHE